MTQEISSRNTKKEIIDAYEELLQSVGNAKADVPKQVQEEKQRKDTVEKVEFREVDNVGRIYINKTNYFEDIPEEIFEFYIGGYKVIDKYLKERKGKDLQIEEIQQVKNIAKIVAFTIEKMKIIDNLLLNID